MEWAMGAPVAMGSGDVVDMGVGVDKKKILH